MAAEEVAKFVLEDFYEILMSANIKEKLKPFIRQFKKKNIPFIYQTIVNTIQIITGKREIPLMKFNALMATKLFFDTGEYVPIVLIEIYLIPIIFEIASYRILKRSEEGLTLYFIEKGGFDPTKEVKRIGFNFVLLAIEFIFMSAQVKPFRNLENQELKQDSNFVKVLKILQEKGLQPIQNYKFYIPSYVNQTRKKYLKRLMKLNAEQYSDFFLKLICDELNLNKKAEIDVKKIFNFGDAYITIPLMHICEDELTNMEVNFVNKKKYLNLIGDFMKLGDIYAVLIITRSSFLENIFNEIQKVKGEKGFQAGQTIYPHVEASKADKKQFYIEYLKHIQIWAYCHPVDQDGQPTDAKKILQILKVQNKFIFPSNILIDKVRREMQENLKLNQKRNQKLIKLVDQYSCEDSKKKVNSSFRQSKISKKSEGLKVNSYIECDQLEQMVLEAKKKLNLIIDKNNLEQTIKSLQKFKNFWEANAEKNEIEADQSADIEIILQEGDLCLTVIEMVLPVYNLYKKEAITFQEYKDRVDILMKKEAQQSLRQVSFQNNLPIQQKSSQVQKFEDYYEKSSLSELQSNIKLKSIKQNSNIQEQPSKNQQSQFIESVKRSEIEKNNSSFHQIPKSQSNISFREESIVPSSKSNLKEISERQSIKSDTIRQSSSIYDKNNFSKRIAPNEYLEKIQDSHQQISVNDSMASRSSRSNRSIRSNKKILERRHQSPAQSRLKSSRQSQSFISSQSINYKDALGKNIYPRNNEDYYQSKQSFISSQNSIVENIVQKQPSKHRVTQKKTQQIILNQQISINDEYGCTQNYGKVFVLNSKNQDYYGIPSRDQKSSKLSRQPSRKSNSRVCANKSQTKIRKYRQNLDELDNSCSQSIIQSYKSGQSELKEDNNKKIQNFHKCRNNPSPNPKKKIPLLLYNKYQQEESIIREPQFNPLMHSFHEQKSMQITNPSKISTFKECFEVNNQIILAKEGKQKLLKFTKGGKIANFIQTAYPKQTPRNSTIVDIISQRNAKRSIQSYRNLRQKSRATETLSQRMKSLQSFNKNMRMKIIVQNQQTKTPMPKVHQPINLLRSSRNGSEPVSFYNDSESSRQKSEANLKSETGQIVNNSEYLNQSRLINQRIYTHYFPSNKTDKLKKCMLKSKSLLLKNEEFQIGCVTNKRQKNIQISLFVTPLKDSIEDINLSVMNDRNLCVKLNNQYIQKIKMNQQQFINIQFKVQNVPYVIPTLNFKFKTNKNYSHNQLLLSIPLSFNKFFTFHPLHEEYLYESRGKIATNDDIITTQQFKCGSKLINSDKTKQSLANFGLIKKTSKSTSYACEAYFMGKIFLLKFGIIEKGTMILEGKNMTGDHKNTKFLEFLLITYKQIFENSKKQRQK